MMDIVMISNFFIIIEDQNHLVNGKNNTQHCWNSLHLILWNCYKKITMPFHNIS
jgi:hypothetical protein